MAYCTKPDLERWRRKQTCNPKTKRAREKETGEREPLDVLKILVYVNCRTRLAVEEIKAEIQIYLEGKLRGLHTSRLKLVAVGICDLLAGAGCPEFFPGG